MKLSQFRTRCKQLIPNVKTSGIIDSDLDVIINEGVCEVNLLAKVYQGYTDFNLVADQFYYPLSTNCPSYFGILKAGLWVRDTNGTLTRIIPRTEEWLNKWVSNWRSAASADMPQYFFFNGDNLVMYPPVNRSTASAARLYHIYKPTDMGDGDKYPYTGGASELTVFRPLDRAIIEYVRSILAPSLNQVTGEDQSIQKFQSFVSRGMRQIKANPAALNDYDQAVQFST